MYRYTQTLDKFTKDYAQHLADLTTTLNSEIAQRSRLKSDLLLELNKQ
jgi:uncharacterized membrane-anchored protein YhcB (DUF1043 family)